MISREALGLGPSIAPMRDAPSRLIGEGELLKARPHSLNFSSVLGSSPGL
jgi:hypothetical protein